MKSIKNIPKAKEKIHKFKGRPKKIYLPASMHPRYSMDDLKSDPKKLMQYKEFSLLPKLIFALKLKEMNNSDDFSKKQENLNNPTESLNNLNNVIKMNDEFEAFLKLIISKSKEITQFTTDFEDLLNDLAIKFVEKNDDFTYTLEIPNIKPMDESLKDKNFIEEIYTIFRKWRTIYDSLKK